MNDICEFNRITVSIPRKKIRRALEDHRYLSLQESLYFGTVFDRLEDAITKLSHVRSLVEKIRLREVDKNGRP